MKTPEKNTKLDPPKWHELIKAKRLELSESQAEFGARFGVTYAAVSEWERGVSEAPARVTWWLAYESEQTYAAR